MGRWAEGAAEGLRGETEVTISKSDHNVEFTGVPALAAPRKSQKAAVCGFYVWVYCLVWTRDQRELSQNTGFREIAPAPAKCGNQAINYVLVLTSEIKQ